MRKTQIALAAVAALVLVAVAAWFLYPWGETPSVASASAQTDSGSEWDSSEMMETGELPDKILGEEDAPVTIVEYASMTCPHCANFHETVFPTLKEKYIDTGQVRFVFREFPLDQLAAAASMVARCVDDSQYFDFVAVLFRTQEEWVNENAVEELKELAKQAGLGAEAFDNCLANQELLDGIVWIQDRARAEFDVSSTPSFFVNGERVGGNYTIAEFERLIAEHSGG